MCFCFGVWFGINFENYLAYRRSQLFFHHGIYFSWTFRVFCRHFGAVVGVFVAGSICLISIECRFSGRSWNFGQLFSFCFPRFLMWTLYLSGCLLLLLIELCAILTKILSFIQDSTGVFCCFLLLEMLYSFYISSPWFSSLFSLYCKFLKRQSGFLDSLSIWFRWDNLPPSGQSLYGYNFHMAPGGVLIFDI